MTNPTARIYLASRSPRRRELLRQIGIAFEELPSSADSGHAAVDETPRAGEEPDAYVMRIARGKARAGASQVALLRLPDCPVLAADTTVVCAGTIMGKPADAAHAQQLLRRLSGATHQVLTAVVVAHGDRIEAALSASARAQVVRPAGRAVSADCPGDLRPRAAAGIRAADLVQSPDRRAAAAENP